MVKMLKQQALARKKHKTIQGTPVFVSASLSVLVRMLAAASILPGFCVLMLLLHVPSIT